MAGDIFAAYRGAGGRFVSGMSIGAEGRSGGQFRSNWPNMVRWASGQVNFRGLSEEYARGEGARAWIGRGSRAHRVRWDVHWDMLPDDPRVLRAAARVVNRTMAEAVLYAKAHHQGWRNRTGRAEASIRTLMSASTRNPEGQWGSDGSAYYFLFLELNYGTLRAASDAVYNPTLMAKQLVSELRKSGWGVGVPTFTRSGRAPN